MLGALETISTIGFMSALGPAEGHGGGKGTFPASAPGE